MGLILKIAAGVIIGSLFVQVITLKYIGYQYENETENVILAQELHTKSIHLMNSIETFYRKNKELPTSLSDLDCSLNEKCTGEVKGSRYYISHKDEWLMIEPFVISDKVKFYCRSTFLNHNISSFSHCTKMNRYSAPIRKGGK